MNLNRWRLQLRDFCKVSLESNGQILTITSPLEQLQIRRPEKGVLEMVSALGQQGVSCQSLEPEGARFDCRQLVTALLRGLFVYFTASGSTPAVRVFPVSNQFRWPFEREPISGDFVLSRFSYLRWKQGKLLLESPLASSRLEIEGEGAAELVSEWLGPWRSPRRLPTSPLQREIFHHLYQSGFLVRSDQTEEEELRQWEFHDLLFHSRTRRGCHDRVSGASSRFGGLITPPPAIQVSPGTADAVRLDTPRTPADKMPHFELILEERKSYRQFGGRLSLADLSHFLYSVARIRQIHEIGGETYTSRPYPSAGSLYPLEIYPVVGQCEGLKRGLFRYDPANHQLEPLAAGPDLVSQLILDAGRGMGGVSVPPVLLILTARFQRVAWRYESIAYSLILKEVGVLMQSMYLVGTALGLATCALGGGNSRLFAEAAGIDPTVEGSVGEFVLGSLPEERPAAEPPATRSGSD